MRGKICKNEAILTSPDGKSKLKVLPLNTKKQLAQLLNTEVQVGVVRYPDPFPRMYDQSETDRNKCDKFSYQPHEGRFLRCVHSALLSTTAQKLKPFKIN